MAFLMFQDISIFIVDELSTAHKLLPSGPEEREKVLELVELHYDNCNIEQVTMGSMMTSNKVGNRSHHLIARVAVQYSGHFWATFHSFGPLRQYFDDSDLYFLLTAYFCLGQLQI